MVFSLDIVSQLVIWLDTLFNLKKMKHTATLVSSIDN